MSDIQVPTCLSGSIGDAPQISICQDGVTHLLYTTTGLLVRVLATNESAAEALKEYSNAKVFVSVCGYWMAPTPCSRIEAYSVTLTGGTSIRSDEYSVYKFTGAGGKALPCIVVPSGGLIPAIYTKDFGPASKSECETYVKSNCRR